MHILLAFKPIRIWQFNLAHLPLPNQNIEIAVYSATTDPAVDRSNSKIDLIRTGVVTALPNRIQNHLALFCVSLLLHERTLPSGFNDYIVLERVA